MVFIQSQHFEISTNQVIDWLIFYQKPFIKLNYEDNNVEFISLDITEEGKVDIVLKVNDQLIELSKVTAYWHRRGKMPLENISKSDYSILERDYGKNISKEVYDNLMQEKQTLNILIDHLFASVPIKVGNPNRGTPIKLSVLLRAAKIGLKISPTMVTSKKQIMNGFRNQQGSIITKAIGENLFTNGIKNNLMFYTEEIKEEHLDRFPDNFFYTLFQKKVLKKYELRIFYFHERMYGMAIFSQGDKHTQTDFRKYNTGIPNRNVPFKIPDDIKEKLTTLMKDMQLDTGSIDMIVDEDDNFIFLEVNPVGQFGMVSLPCNYQLEREIAHYLAYGKFLN
ncbi:MAG: peptide maturase, grasp-with-spasm system [Mucilaginibacter sp.]|nr:peptide maturase, grasp-with-spasm system [Mucilaginibacter sp.]